MIKDHRSLASLSGDLRRKNSQSQGLASWVPDWSAIIDESDRKRMAIQSVYNACSGWRVTVFETADEYWNHVAEEMDLLVQDLQKPGRQSRQIAAQLRVALSEYAQWLKKWLEKYTDYQKQMTESILPFFRAYKRFTNKLQDKSFWSPRGKGSKLSEYPLIDIPIKPFYDIYYEFASKNKLGCYEQAQIIQACQDLLEKNRPMDGPASSVNNETVTEEGPRFNPWNVGRVAIAHISFLAKLDEHLLRARPSPPVGPIDKICQSCALLLEITKEGCDHVTPTPTIIKTEELFNFSVIFRGRSSWMSDLHDPRIVDNLHDIMYNPDPSHDKTTLQTESEFIGEVQWCGTKLTTWIDVDSGLLTVGTWMRELFHSNPLNDSWETNQRENLMLSFMRTLVGGICWRAEGLDRICASDHGSLSRWFKLSLLPKLRKVCSINDEVTQTLDHMVEPYSVGSSEKRFDKEMHLVTEGRVFFQTDDGRMGLGPASMAPTDEIHVLPGGQTHFVLRPRPEGSTTEFELIGDCFLDQRPSDSDEEETPPLNGSLPQVLALICYNHGLDVGGRRRISLK